MSYDDDRKHRDDEEGGEVSDEALDEALDDADDDDDDDDFGTGDGDEKEWE